MREIEDGLVIRVRMDGGHETALDPECIIDHLRHGGQAVGRARRIRDDVVGLRVVLVLIDPEHDGDVLTFRWC